MTKPVDSTNDPHTRENDDLREQLAASQARVTELRTMVENYGATIDELRGAREESRQAQARVADAERYLKMAGDRADREADQTRSAREEARQAQARLEECEGDLDEAETNLAASESRVAELEAEAADNQRGFDLRWAADQRAIDRWRAAAPGRDLVRPDHADLCVWLLEQLAASEASIKSLRVALADLRHDVWMNEDPSNSLKRADEILARSTDPIPEAAAGGEQSEPSQGVDEPSDAVAESAPPPDHPRAAEGLTDPPTGDAIGECENCGRPLVADNIDRIGWFCRRPAHGGTGCLGEDTEPLKDDEACTTCGKTGNFIDAVCGTCFAKGTEAPKADPRIARLRRMLVTFSRKSPYVDNTAARILAWVDRGYRGEP